MSRGATLEAPAIHPRARLLETMPGLYGMQRTLAPGRWLVELSIARHGIRYHVRRDIVLGPDGAAIDVSHSRAPSH